MAYVNLGYGNLITWPPRLMVGISAEDTLTTNAIIDAQDEEVHFIGELLLPNGTASVTADTNTTIGFVLSPTTFANAGTTLRVGIQDVDVTTGVPGRGDGTWDVYADYVGATDTLTQNAWNTITMESGSKTISHGQLIALCFKLIARAGSDSISITYASCLGTTSGRPLVASSVGAGWVGRPGIPLVAVNFNGTWATLCGASTYKSRLATTFNSTSTPDERGAFFTLPFACKIAGLSFRNAGGSSSTTYKVQIYSDPAGTPAVISGASKTVDTASFAATTANDGSVLFDAPVALAANTRYVVAIQPQDSTNVGYAVSTYESADIASLHMGGANWTYATRSDNTGAFSETTTQKMLAQLLISDIADGGGASPVYGDRTGGLR